MLYLACYDIEHDRLRQQVADLLLKTGLERIQYSVFMGPLTDTQKDLIEDRVSKWFTELTGCDFLLVPLPKYSTDNAQHLGNNPPDWVYLMGEKLVLII